MTQVGQVRPGTNYTVQSGDSLFSIAQEAYGNGASWPLIYDANKQVIGPNPNFIRVGEVLVIPVLSPMPGTTYVVRQGDTLFSIAQRAYGDGNQWHLIYNANKQVIGANPDLIRPGEVLHLPLAPSPALPLRNSTEIQGDILAAFNKDHRMYLFFTFPNQASGRAWLKELIPFIAKTQEVAGFNATFSAARAANGGVDPPHHKATWINVSLTFNGLKVLLKADPTNALKGQGFTSFVAGPETRAGDIGDTGSSGPQHWKFGRENQHVHAMLNIQSDDLNALDAKVQELKALASKHGLTRAADDQPCATFIDPVSGETGHEHFGFKDGISQPGVEGFDPPDPKDPNKDPSAPLGHVLGHPGTEIIPASEFILVSPPDNLKWMKNGSFQVVRRLRQNVPQFWNEITSVAQADGSISPEMLGAKLVGRWKSGAPIDLSSEKDNKSLASDASNNNFNFMMRDNSGALQADGDGLRCPRFAHIRKVYPRQHDQFGDRIRRILRRGVPFGPPFDPSGRSRQDASAERGLFFVAYMSSIEDKFEFLMGAWVNSPGFPFDVPQGPDAVIGVQSTPCIINRKGKPPLQHSFTRWVDTTGTLYAFVPSLSALNQMANGQI